MIACTPDALRFSRVHFVCKFVCKFAQQQPPPRQGGRTVLALQKRRCYALAPAGPANRDAFREPGASPRPKSPAVSKLSWGKNVDIFVRKWAIWRLNLGVATTHRRRLRWVGHYLTTLRGVRRPRRARPVLVRTFGPITGRLVATPRLRRQIGQKGKKAFLVTVASGLWSG